MVEALLEGRKSITRRTKGLDIINEVGSIYNTSRFDVMNGKNVAIFCDSNKVRSQLMIDCPYQPDSILWVRETWLPNTQPTGWPYHFYAANDTFTNRDNEKWKSSLFMPKKACRLFLKVIFCRAERLHNITDEDILKEGIKKFYDAKERRDKYGCYSWAANAAEATKGQLVRQNTAKLAFAALWMHLKGQDSWLANPWVWRIGFEQIVSN